MEYGPIIQEQTQLRQDTAWAFYLIAIDPLIAIGMTRSRHARWGIVAVLVGSVFLFWLSVWLHKKECEVYHPNIKRHAVTR